MFLYFFGYAFSPLFIVNIAFASLVVFSSRHHPGSTWAWLFVILVLPYLGIILYFVFGFDGRKSALFQKKRAKDALILREFTELSDKEYSDNSEGFLGDAGSAADIIYLGSISGRSRLTTGNAVDLYFEGGDKFEALLADIEGAESFIWLEYYIVRADALARRLIAALEARSRAGVSVCVLVDGMGCPRGRRGIFAPLIEAGGRVGVFAAAHSGGLNYRNHRKIAVVDGCVGYIGGLNIGEEYLGGSKRFGYWRDAHIRVQGGVVAQLCLRFVMDWNFVHKHPGKLVLPEILKPEDDPGRVAMQLLSSGPDTRWPSIHHTIIKMISTSRTQVLIQSPYFVPDDSVLEALRLAALSGVDVRIMIPAKPDHPFVYWAALSYIGELLQAGVRCYRYEKGFLHSKTIVVDGRISSVGTANMDVRSFKLNFEISAFMYDESLGELLITQFMRDIKDCSEISREYYGSRSRWDRVRESVSRLLSPIL